MMLKLTCRSPSWGAWIEIPILSASQPPLRVAPPRGERGLKYSVILLALCRILVAPPRGERGLKYWRVQTIDTDDAVAPPRGERGLK